MANPLIRSVEQYTRQLQGLLPRGILWRSLINSTFFAGVFNAMANEAARISQRMADLFEETDPRTASELLDELEQFAGLPDHYVTALGITQTLQERRAALHARLTATGGASRQYFIGLAATLGYSITIVEYQAFVCGISMCGWPLNPAEMRFVWRVKVPAAKLIYFRTGLSRCGERLLAIGRAEDLECVLTRLKPAQTQLIFDYTGV